MNAVTPGQNLTREETRWLNAFRAMDARGRRQNLMLMEDDALRNPSKKTPVFRLIIGGAK